MLAIEVEYLLGRSFAADFQDQDKPEWPPHPERLFSAMVAAHHDTYGTDEERAALEWFQRLDPPEICAGEAGVGNIVVNFVSSNYAGKSGSPHPEQRGKQPRTFPAQGPASPVVQFVWPTVEPEDGTRATLAGLVERVGSLGRACSLVRVSLTDSPADRNHVPDDRGPEVVRVVGEGRLEELESVFQNGLRPRPGAQRRYRLTMGDPVEDIAESCFGEMIVLRKVPGKASAALPIEASLTLTIAVRKALLRIADENGTLCDAVTGHGVHPHCAFVALPFAGEDYADGRLLGAAVLLPRDVSRVDRKKVLKACVELSTINLRDEKSIWLVEIAGFDIALKTLQPSTWVRPSRVWKTVSPILLDQFPKTNLSVESILARCCERIGLPEPVAIEHSPYSSLAGVSPVPEFRLLRTGEDRPRWGVHATLTFSQPVRGPVVLGAGRYFGLGLMKPTRRDRDDS